MISSKSHQSSTGKIRENQESSSSFFEISSIFQLPLLASLAAFRRRLVFLAERAKLRVCDRFNDNG